MKIRTFILYLLSGALYFSSTVFAADPPKKTGPDVWWEAENNPQDSKAASDFANPGKRHLTIGWHD
jgi:hypothetical protein